MKIGLFIGRFQPFHKGHLAIIKLALQEVDEIKIVLGSSQESRTAKNPLTVKEREEILTKTLENEGITQYSFFRVPDINDDARYPGHVAEIVGHFDIVYAGENELVKRLFEEAGYTVVTSERLNGWMATEIRERILQGEDVEDLVPQTVHELLEEKYREIIKKTLTLLPAPKQQ